MGWGWRDRIDRTYIVSGLHIALPSQLACVNVQVPRLRMYCGRRVGLLCGCRTGRLEHWSKHLGLVLRVKILCVYASRTGRLGGSGCRRLRGSTCNEDVAFDGGGESTEENIVDMLADKTGVDTSAQRGTGFTEMVRTHFTLPGARAI